MHCGIDREEEEDSKQDRPVAAVKFIDFNSSFQKERDVLHALNVTHRIDFDPFPVISTTFRLRQLVCLTDWNLKSRLVRP